MRASVQCRASGSSIDAGYEMTNENDVLLRGFTIAQIQGCIADPAKNRVIAEFWDDISPVFPYLNATVPNIMYSPDAHFVTIRRDGRLLTFYPHVAKMAKLDGREDAEAQLRWFQELVNETWRRRDQISPCYERRQVLGWLDIYHLLPRLNCKERGLATCTAFAFALLLQERELPDCPHIGEPEYAEGGNRLAELLI